MSDSAVHCLSTPGPTAVSLATPYISTMNEVCRGVLGSRLGIQRLSHGDEESEKRYTGELVTALSVDPALPSPFHHRAECRHELQIEVRLHVHLRLYKADLGNFNLVCLLRAQSQFSVIVIGIGFKHNYVLGVRTV